MDQNTEGQIIGAVNQWLRGRTLILVTHRLQLLGMVNRVAVMEKGQIVLDGPRDEVLAKLQGDSSQQTAKPGQSAQPAQPVGRV
jgi:ATP-binding cassette subfamily C protein LapB